MSPEIARRKKVAFQIAGTVLLALAMLALPGCAARPPALAHAPAPMTPELQACTDWYEALDAEIDQAGVRDAGETRIAGFRHLRLDRFTASHRDALRLHLSGTDPEDRADSLMRRLQELDLKARDIEIRNLNQPARAKIAAHSGVTADTLAMLQRTRDCARRLGASDLASPQRMVALRERMEVPDDYVTPYRVLGLYPLTRLPFSAGVERFEVSRSLVFSRNDAPPVGSSRLRLSPPARPPPGVVTHQRLGEMLAPAAGDPLQVPAPSADDLEFLFAQFAPGFDIALASDDDRPGALVWRPSALNAASSTLEVDRATPAVYRQVGYTRHGAASLLQLSYILWFPARSAESNARLDLLAGKLDGLVFRVTLAPDGSPVLYDTIHPCGCYHMFFPTPLARPKAAPEPGIEWAFSPQSLPHIGPSDRLVIRVAAGTHYIDQVSVERADSQRHYVWRDYDELRSLPDGSQTYRSVFGPDGFIVGTDRLEAWLFWPMGIPRAGAMRQSGRQPTAFVGRRHFDDADLIEKRFILDLKPAGR
jgi:hypothetical protein